MAKKVLGGKRARGWQPPNQNIKDDTRISSKMKDIQRYVIKDFQLKYKKRYTVAL